MLNKSPKIIVVSFDGGVWSNLIPIARSGIMPNLARLLDEGKYTNFESTIPPVTPPAWTAFMTGCNPGKTGVFDFYEYQKGSYKPILTTSKSIKADTLWKILSDNGFRVGVVDVPINYPPPQVNGYIVSGWERPSNKKVFTYPPELGSKLIDKLGDYPICLRTFDRHGTKDTEFLDKLIEITTKVGQAATWLLETDPVDFFMVHFQTTDIIQHSFWNQVASLDFNSTDPLLVKIWDFYKNLDSQLEKIYSFAGSESNIFLVSDHGFGPVKRRMATNIWLKENGYLKLKQDIGTQIRTTVKSTAIKVVNKVDALAKLKNRIKKITDEEREQRIIVPRSQDDPIDYGATTAFSGIGTAYGAIQLNLVGREPSGTVPPKEAEELKKEIISKLINIKDPISGESFVKGVYRREEIFKGNEVDRIPDLIIIPENGFYFFSGTIEKELFHEASPLSFGNHVKEGIFAVKGVNLEKMILKDLKITDFVPTVLSIFGLKTPSYMDGTSFFLEKEMLSAK